MKMSFITTVFNEEENIEKLLDSLLLQTKLPQEIVIVDAKSTDSTVKKIKNYELRFNKKGINYITIIKVGNRSVGRNEAIRNCSGDIIICSDAGCVLDKVWVENITKPFSNPQVDVVAGYYKGIAKNVFQKCLIPYALVMPDKVDPANFFPSTRSIAFRKLIWKKVGGFPEQFSYSEDFVFARKLKELASWLSGQKVKMVFQKNAVAHWIPRENIIDAFIMFFRFAKGDSKAKILRPKVLLLFMRYLIGIVVFVWNIQVLLLLLIVYLAWSIVKNYKYVLDFRALFILPLLQITADTAVITGTIMGIL